MRALSAKPQDEPMFVFKAKPMPVFESIAPPKKPETKEMSIPEPFRLKTEDRGEIATQRLQMKLEDERRREEEARYFKAQPIRLNSEPVNIHDVILIIISNIDSQDRNFFSSFCYSILKFSLNFLLILSDAKETSSRTSGSRAIQTQYRQ